MANLPSKTVQDDLPRIKECISRGNKWLADIKRDYDANTSFAFHTTMLESDKSDLEKYERPTLTFNVIESFVNRLLGEFGRIVPAPDVTPAQPTIIAEQLAKIVEQLLQEGFEHSDYKNVFRRVFKCMLSGMGVLKMYTEYESPMSFRQRILFKDVIDPTTVAFDPSAKMPSKSDARWCFEKMDMTLEDFKEKFPGADASKIKSSEQGWCRTDESGQESVCVYDFFEKVAVRKKILLISYLENEVVIEADRYNEIYEKFYKPRGLLEPEILDKRKQITYKVVHYRLFRDQILDKNETEFKRLPYFFFDGNSYWKDGKQYIRSYFDNVKDTQRAKNICGNIFLDEILNVQKNKIIFPLSGLKIQNQDVINAWKDVNLQQGFLLYKDWDTADKRQIAPPSALQRAPIAPEYLQFFQMCDSLIQSILGSYQEQVAMNEGNMSGKALIEMGTASNAASKPYILNFIQPLRDMTMGIMETLPNVVTHPRTVEIDDGKGGYVAVAINNPNDPMSELKYSEMDLMLDIHIGNDFEMQKQRDIQALVNLAQAIPAVQNVFNSPKALKSLVFDNLEMRGSQEASAVLEEQSEAAKKQPQQPSPDVQIAMMTAQTQMMQQQNSANDIAYKQEKLKQDGQLEFMKLQMQSEEGKQKLAIERGKLIIKLQEVEDKKSKDELQASIDMIDKMIETQRTAAM